MLQDEQGADRKRPTHRKRPPSISRGAWPFSRKKRPSAFPLQASRQLSAKNRGRGQQPIRAAPRQRSQATTAFNAAGGSVNRIGDTDTIADCARAEGPPRPPRLQGGCHSKERSDRRIGRTDAKQESAFGHRTHNGRLARTQCELAVFNQALIVSFSAEPAAGRAGQLGSKPSRPRISN
jgi:hypothetical protein